MKKKGHGKKKSGRHGRTFPLPAFENCGCGNDIICYFVLWWVIGMGAVCVSNTPSGHKPRGQQGLKLKIGIHHLMASTEWVLSDDWKLWHDAQWGSCINHFRVLRSAAFNIRPVEKPFSQFDSFSCFLCYRHLWCGDHCWWSGEQANWKVVYFCCSFSLERKYMVLFPPLSPRLFQRHFKSKSKLSSEPASTLLHGVKLTSRCTLK